MQHGFSLLTKAAIIGPNVFVLLVGVGSINHFQLQFLILCLVHILVVAGEGAPA